MKKYLKLIVVVLFVFLITACTEKKVEKYKVIFDSNGGTTVTEQYIKKNGNVVRPTDPIKEGYKFIGWQKNYVNYNFNEKVKSDIRLVAKWEKIDSKKVEQPVTEQPKQNEDTGNNTKQPTSGTTSPKNDNTNPGNTTKPVDNKNNNISVKSKAESYKFNIGDDKDVTSLFTFDFGNNNGVVTCTQSNKNISNIKNLAAGKYVITCTLKANNGKTAQASTNVEIINNIKTQTINFNSASAIQSKTITIDNLDSIVEVKVDKGNVSVSKDGNKVTITVKDNNNPSCNYNSGYYETLFYSDGSKCSTYYLYTYVNGIISNVKCIEIPCKDSVYDSTTHKTVLYPDNEYNKGCKCPDSNYLKSMIGTDTKNGLSQTVKVPSQESVCIYTAKGNWISPSWTCSYGYTVTLTYKVK